MGSVLLCEVFSCQMFLWEEYFSYASLWILNAFTLDPSQIVTDSAYHIPTNFYAKYNYLEIGEIVFIFSYLKQAPLDG